MDLLDPEDVEPVASKLMALADGRAGTGGGWVEVKPDGDGAIVEGLGLNISLLTAAIMKVRMTQMPKSLTFNQAQMQIQ